MGQRMQSKHLLIGAAIAALLAAASTSAVAESAAERQLIEQGQYWQRDSARATQAWNKLLLARPGSADALLGWGQLQSRPSRWRKRSRILRNMKQLHPDHPDIALLEQDIALMAMGCSAFS